MILVLLLMLLVGVNAMKNERFFLFYLWRNVVLIRLRKVAFSADYGKVNGCVVVRFYRSPSFWILSPLVSKSLLEVILLMSGTIVNLAPVTLCKMKVPQDSSEA